MMPSGRLSLGLAAVALLVAGCQTVPLDRPSASGPAEAPAAAVTDPPKDPESVALERHYARVEASLVARGLLRRDGGGPDTPFDADDLARNFQRIALFEEYADVGGRLVARETESRLHRWESPVRLVLHFGDAVPAEKVQRDRVAVRTYAARLARLTGLPIRMSSTGGNFHVFIVTEAERRALPETLRGILPGLGQSAIDTVVDLPRSSYCLVFASDGSDTGAYDTAIAVIRAEHPDLMRLSCIHEELAQGLGLANDSPAARPSVFNDDEEFGLLTTHDELLLRILYDRRLKPGMTTAEAMPVVRVIAGELRPGPAL